MPLEEKTIVDVREEMALAALEVGATVTEVAMRFGVSRPTVRLWGVIVIGKTAEQVWKIVLMRPKPVHTGRTRRSKS